MAWLRGPHRRRPRLGMERGLAEEKEEFISSDPWGSSGRGSAASNPPGYR